MHVTKCKGNHRHTKIPCVTNQVWLSLWKFGGSLAIAPSGQGSLYNPHVGLCSTHPQQVSFLTWYFYLVFTLSTKLSEACGHRIWMVDSCLVQVQYEFRYWCFKRRMSVTAFDLRNLPSPASVAESLVKTYFLLPLLLLCLANCRFLIFYWTSHIRKKG